MADGARIVVYAAAAANLAIGAVKLWAFAFTGSTAMLTEAIHSFVDTGNEALLLFGMAEFGFFRGSFLAGVGIGVAPGASRIGPQE